MPANSIRSLQIASRLFVKRGLPVNLIFFVTSRCNLLCTHCFYWEELNKPKNELSLPEIERISRSLPNLLSLSLTGGEPYLRPDLPEIASLFEQHSHVRNIQIPSNGLLVDKTIERVESLLQRVQRARVATGVSLDGPEDIHNRIRQNPKSFARAIETLRQMKKLKKDFSNLSVGVAMTISAANQHCLEEFFRFVTEELQPDAITVTLTRGNPLDESLKAVDIELYRQFARKVIQYCRHHNGPKGWADRLVIAKEQEVYRLIGEAAGASHRVSACYGGELVGILSETGDVYMCETLEKSMGNVREFDCNLAELWESTGADEGRRYQKQLGCQCTYECAMSVNTLFNPRRAWRILLNSW